MIAWDLAAARALGRLHRLGVVHRNVKPANLHLGDDGRLRLLDLGVALSGSEPAEQRDLHAGTPSYMSPERWDNAPASAGSDLFALGVTLYQLLTGLLPYGSVGACPTFRTVLNPAMTSLGKSVGSPWVQGGLRPGKAITVPKRTVVLRPTAAWLEPAAREAIINLGDRATIARLALAIGRPRDQDQSAALHCRPRPKDRM